MFQIPYQNTVLLTFFCLFKTSPIIKRELPEVKPRPLPKPMANSFSNSFESFLQQNKPLAGHSDTLPAGRGLIRTSSSSGGANRSNGNNQSVVDSLENLKDGGATALTPEVNKWGQNCDNCAALVHLMYNHLHQISAGQHHPIQDGTTEEEIIQHLATALGYNERQVHRMIKMGHNPYRCRHCAAAFGTRVELDKHVGDTHGDIATIPCPECDKWYKTQDSMQAHLRNAHKPPVKKDYICPVVNCNAGYTNYGTLKRHVQKKHPEIPIPSDPSQKEVKTPATRGRGRGRGRGGRGRGRGRGGRGFSNRYHSSEDEETELEEESDEFYASSRQEESDESIDFQEDRY